MAMPARTPKQHYLDAYDREHPTTTRVLRAYPVDRLDLRPHPKCKTARELAWVFIVEIGLTDLVLNDGLRNGIPSMDPPAPPEAWSALLGAFESAHNKSRALVAGMTDETLHETVKFFTAPKTMTDVVRMDFLWFMLSDHIHHRGQFSIYLRMADGKVPSIYGPSADEPWL